MDRQILDKSYLLGFEGLYLHPEENGNTKINKSLTVINNDLKYIHKNEKIVANKINTLLSNTVERFKNIKNIINSEKERLQDISMLCNKYTDYDNVILLKKDDFNGNFNCSEDNIYTSEIIGSNKTEIKILDVIGNGYEGNKYVIKDNKFIEQSLETYKQRHLIDNSINTYWEYSRISTGSEEEVFLSDFNKDNEDAKCTISIMTKDNTNELDLISENDNIKIIHIQYSTNGVDYLDLNINPFVINKKDESYKNYGYIYGSGKISVPLCKYFKITLQSIGITNDTIGFEKTIASEDNSKSKKVIQVVTSAKRHVIKLNDIYAYKNNYTSSSILTTDNLIKSDVYSVSLFANTYIPSKLQSSNVEYILTVNGVDYKVQPVNSHNNGIKVIRFSQGKSPNIFTEYIGEIIKTVTLTVKIKGNVNVTPYINNIKLLIGGEI